MKEKEIFKKVVEYDEKMSFFLVLLCLCALFFFILGFYYLYLEYKINLFIYPISFIFFNFTIFILSLYRIFEGRKVYYVKINSKTGGKENDE